MKTLKNQLIYHRKVTELPDDWEYVWLGAPKSFLHLDPLGCHFMDDPGHEVRTSWKTWILASVLHTSFIFEDHSVAVRNHFPGVSSLWYCHFIQHQLKMQTWSHSLSLLGLALPSLCSVQRSCSQQIGHVWKMLKQVCVRWFVVSNPQFCSLGSGTGECCIWGFDTRSQMKPEASRGQGLFSGF